MLTTRFTELVGCSVPIQSAGMGGLIDPRLPAAVASAGGLGMVPLGGGYSAEEVNRQLDAVRALTDGVIGANFLVPFLGLDDEREVARACVAAAAARAKVVEFFWGEPDAELVATAHAGGALACWQVGSRREAQAAMEAGCDLIVAQGIEAGGHVRGRIGLLALLDEVLAEVSVPVLAAGGIGSGRTMAAALAAGAAGVRVGTRFVAAEESGAHPDYVRALIAAHAEDTVYTQAFSGGWADVGQADAPHRVLRSSLEAATAFTGDVVGHRTFPGDDQVYPISRFHSATPTTSTTGTIAAMPLWAGESVSGVRAVRPAREIVEEMVGEAERLLRRWG